MFTIDVDGTISLTRGDVAIIKVSAKKSEDQDYTFKVGDVVRLSVFEKKRCDNVVLRKEVTVTAETTIVTIPLSKTDTKLGELINKPVDYWYEVELNPDTIPQTIIGYDLAGPKIFRLFPEGDDKR